MVYVIHFLFKKFFVVSFYKICIKILFQQVFIMHCQFLFWSAELQTWLFPMKLRGGKYCTHFSVPISHWREKLFDTLSVFSSIPSRYKQAQPLYRLANEGTSPEFLWSWSTYTHDKSLLQRMLISTCQSRCN